MAWVTFEGKLYCLPTQTKLTETEFQALQQSDPQRHVMIFAPEGGHENVAMLELEHAELEFHMSRPLIDDVALDLGPFALDLEASISAEAVMVS